MSIESQHGFVQFFAFFSLCKAHCAKGFSKFLKIGLSFSVFIFAIFKHRILSRFLFIICYLLFVSYFLTLLFITLVRP